MRRSAYARTRSDRLFLSIVRKIDRGFNCTYLIETLKQDELEVLRNYLVASLTSNRYSKRISLSHMASRTRYRIRAIQAIDEIKCGVSGAYPRPQLPKPKKIRGVKWTL